MFTFLEHWCLWERRTSKHGVRHLHPSSKRQDEVVVLEQCGRVAFCLDFAPAGGGPPARLQLAEGGLCEVKLLCHVYPASRVYAVLAGEQDKRVSSPGGHRPGAKSDCTDRHTRSLPGRPCSCLTLRGPTS